MKFNILKPALAALVLVGTACTANYLDINTNPYEPSEDDMQTDGYIIGSALTSLEHRRIDRDRKSTRLNSSHPTTSRMPSSA